MPAVAELPRSRNSSTVETLMITVFTSTYSRQQPKEMATTRSDRKDSSAGCYAAEAGAALSGSFRNSSISTRGMAITLCTSQI